MTKFKPTAEEWQIIKQIAFLAHDSIDTEIRSVAGVQLECREHVNVNDHKRPRNINAALVSDEIDTGWNDLDLWDCSTVNTMMFRTGTELSAEGRGIFDFYIYNRYDRDGGLCGNVLVDVVEGKMRRIWVEGGKACSWTPETGIVPGRMIRQAA